MVNYLKASQLENINLFFIIAAIKQKFLCKLGRKKHFLKLKYHFRSCMCEERLKPPSKHICGSSSRLLLRT